ncbi:MAG: hypothetical protein ACR2FO_07200 [Actinomycetota bacterium]
MPEWFRRFAEIPGVTYASDPDIDRSMLPGHDSVPKVERWSFEGESTESVMWGETSQSPAGQWSSQIPEKPSLKTLVSHLKEVLELPGDGGDYHFAIQGCVSELWKLRRSDPGVPAAVEDLCWLDIRLIQALTHTIRHESSEETNYYQVVAFERLIELYERDGFIREALEVAKLAKDFGQGGNDFDRLSGTLSTLEAEDAS